MADGDPPRPGPAVADPWVSQRTCLDLLGLIEPEYLARVKSWKLRPVRDGKRVLTRKSDWDAEFEKRREPEDASQQTGVDAVYAKLGLRRR